MPSPTITLKRAVQQIKMRHSLHLAFPSVPNRNVPWRKSNGQLIQLGLGCYPVSAYDKLILSR